MVYCFGHWVLEYCILYMVPLCGGSMKEAEAVNIGVMKNPIEKLNKVFDSRIRLGIMSALMVNTEVNYNTLKELMEVTDGNLASHLKTLEENGYIKMSKNFIGRKTNTTYTVTKAGEKAFKEHIDALEKMIKSLG